MAPPNNIITVTSSSLWQQPTKESSSDYISLLKSCPPPSFTKSISGVMSDDNSSRRRRQSTGLRCSMISINRKTNTKKLNTVKFDDGESSCVVHQLESTEDVYPQELWFSKKEIQDMRKEGRDILAKVKDAGGDVAASAVDEIRGLEHGLSVRDSDCGSLSSIIVELAGAPLGRSERRKNIVETILSQQQEQKDAGIDDPKGLAVTSKACTQWASDRAYDVATKDFEEAVEIYKSDPACAELLPSILNKKKDMRRRRSSVMSSTSAAASVMSADERKAALENISQTVASALEELDDLDF